MGQCFSRRREPISKRRRPLPRSSSAANGGLSGGGGGSTRWTRTRSKKDQTLINEQALAAAIILHQQIGGGGGSGGVGGGGGGVGGGVGIGFDRSASVRYTAANTRRNEGLPRSSSTRARSLTDPLLQPHQLVNQEIKLDELETNHIVLVHGGGFGAWCWYKTIALFEKEGYKVTAIDLTGSGIHSFDTNSITSLSQYVKPLSDLLENLTEAEKEIKLDELETNHIVLVHGGGFGAWCWYKTIALFEKEGYKVTAIDLTGSGIHSFDTNSITSLSQYVKPLSDLLENLTEAEKVILVGHDFGGACISYAMERNPTKISKAVYVAAVMLASGQSTLDIFSQKVESNELMQHAQIFLYSNGNSQPPTAIDFDKTLLKDLLFNQSPSKDVALASVSMKPIPFAPVLEKLSLSDMKYGSVRRFYIETPEDNAIPIAIQEAMINRSPPQQVFRLKGADHSPFFSKPQALHKLLVEISKIPRN
ncbi:esterase [Lithospermum erythrorhizon]|uniref:Esterase n=1 Tax=Lithospermum erythrorhizon TaxID=34254 RepID=A0AAV3NZA1_LITER